MIFFRNIAVFANVVFCLAAPTPLKPSGSIVDLTQNAIYSDVDSSTFAYLTGYDMDNNYETLALEAFGININNKEGSTLYIINNEDDMKDPRKGDLMYDTKNVFLFKSSRVSLYYNETDASWYSFKLKDKLTSPVKPQTFSDLIPVTACLSSKDGDGGSVSITYEVDIQASDYLAGSGTFAPSMSPLSLSGTLGVTVGPTFSYIGSYTCNIDAGEYGQLFIEPFYVEVPESSRIQVAYEKHKGVVLKGKKYEEFNKFKVLVKNKPNHYCVSGKTKDDLQCSGDIAI
ncbi:uncharacterized protein PRCAT00002096001 [Priceomyces carsonii]|uniref:uncharacterized protein n=1 Tax=Priceomyces carsonii TaxID=28549 RepID=UPI002EDB6ECD|nr:unnamed protein product [Priceomyces carsonii]